jgi:hypothetical protein
MAVMTDVYPCNKLFSIKMGFYKLFFAYNPTQPLSELGVRGVKHDTSYWLR